ncbi:HNH endonuclease family protein [Mycetocola sp. JXN-3]|uniref:HNH endonuclease family protein n=1 Tax=Mycetocola sp. JXN-3 TaxID=2116510 RepID=UPI0021067603|nr:HNH endonuclease family protein [Mycetocola sp. JXN-3]
MSARRRRPSPKTAALLSIPALIAALIVGALSLGETDAQPYPTPGAAASGVPGTSGTSGTDAFPAGFESAGNARDLLATIPVRGRAPGTGYDRVARFGTAWFDVEKNGCDTRNDILARDLTEVTTRGGCRVLTGVLDDPYTGTRIEFERGEKTSQAVQIDHVVALKNAWQTGAQALTDDRRRELANDPINLLAVDGPTNTQKSDGDAATWLPPRRAAWCGYVARQVSVKAAYGLWMTRAEHDRIGEILESCPDQQAARSPFAR